jgi:hypothetical protein
MEEFRTWELPELASRDVYFPIVQGKATVITGMRRTGGKDIPAEKRLSLMMIFGHASKSRRFQHWKKANHI